MEADWYVEIGPGLPCIDGCWEGFVDLRADPLAIHQVEEAAQHRGILEALLALNGDNSPVFTTKCDTWALAGSEIDPYEFGAKSDAVRLGFACYIDIMARDFARFGSFAFQEKWARGLAIHLRAVDLPRCHVDVVLRTALVNEQQGYGLTLYSASCGASEADAYMSWRAVLAATVAATIAAARASSSIG